MYRTGGVEPCGAIFHHIRALARPDLASIIADMTDGQDLSAQAPPDGGRHLVLGTAGHIDHGKTSLIRALTGTDTDRLPEEKARGMTIELGFAELRLDDIDFSVVDVPGHERFVRTMVAGATGIDIALLVIAADDSVMPQTIEHSDILHLLGIRRAVVAVTKVDMVDEEMVELVIDDVERLLEGTPLANAPIVPVSSVTGSGLEKLRQTIGTVAGDVRHQQFAHPFRMAVDRVFAITGRGTVVTGSALRGTVQTGDTLEVWPGNQTCRVRSLQAYGADQTALACGQRMGINISGIDREVLDRGSELATPGYLQQSRLLDVRVHSLASMDRPIKSTSIVRLGIGTSEVRVRIVFTDRGALDPGTSAYAQLRCGENIASVYGQHFIIRHENASRTIGGGIVLRPVGLRRRRDPEGNLAQLQTLEAGDPADRLEQVLRAARFTRPEELALCARAGIELADLAGLIEHLQQEKRYIPVPNTDVFTVPAAVEDLTTQLSSWLERFHRAHPDTPGRLVDSVVGWLERMTQKSLARPLLAWFVKRKKIKTIGRFVCLPAFAPELSGADERLLAAMVSEIKAGRFQPPALGQISGAEKADKKRLERIATLAVALGDLVKIDSTVYLHAEMERELRDVVGTLASRDEGVTVSEAREALNSTRKYMVPIMEYLDREGFTKRKGDARVLAASK